jgi:hypothetical protein
MYIHPFKAIYHAADWFERLFALICRLLQCWMNCEGWARGRRSVPVELKRVEPKGALLIPERLLLSELGGGGYEAMQATREGMEELAA